MSVFVVAALLGCAGDLDPTGFPVPDPIGGPLPAKSPADGACDVPTIFASYGCPTCHDVKGSFGGFDMASPGWETHLVGVAPKGGGASSPSVCTGGGRVYLAAGSSPATGLFMDKLKPKTASSCGDRMPLIADPLTSAELDCVQQWANALTAAH